MGIPLQLSVCGAHGQPRGRSLANIQYCAPRGSPLELDRVMACLRPSRAVGAHWHFAVALWADGLAQSIKFNQQYQSGQRKDRPCVFWPCTSRRRSLPFRPRRRSCLSRHSLYLGTSLLQSVSGPKWNEKSLLEADACLPFVQQKGVQLMITSSPSCQLRLRPVKNLTDNSDIPPTLFREQRSLIDPFCSLHHITDAHTSFDGVFSESLHSTHLLWTSTPPSRAKLTRRLYC